MKKWTGGARMVSKKRKERANAETIQRQFFVHYVPQPRRYCSSGHRPRKSFDLERLTAHQNLGLSAARSDWHATHSKSSDIPHQETGESASKLQSPRAVQLSALDNEHYATYQPHGHSEQSKNGLWSAENSSRYFTEQNECIQPLHAFGSWSESPARNLTQLFTNHADRSPRAGSRYASPQHQFLLSPKASAPKTSAEDSSSFWKGSLHHRPRITDQFDINFDMFGSPISHGTRHFYAPTRKEFFCNI